jgi:uncharacterized protein
MPSLTQPLTDAELDRLDHFFQTLNPGEGMSLEELDGFFCALICSPDVVPPSEYLPIVFGGELVQGHGVSTLEEGQELLNLLTRHWNTIAATLLRDEPYPILIERGDGGDDGDLAGEEWAQGFELGMSLRDDSWNRLIEDDEFSAALIPIIALAEASNPDSGLTPMTPEVRAEAIDALAEGVRVYYHYFRDVVPGSTVAGRKKPKRVSKRRKVQ